MRKFLTMMGVTAAILLCTIIPAGKAYASPQACRVNGAKHVPVTQRFINTETNKQKYYGTLYTCECGATVIRSDANYRQLYFYPSDCEIKYTPRYPSLPGSSAYYVPRVTYTGIPSEWHMTAN
ncbi:hypothetical protein [Clostridium botulinum]|uniref:hypothetical protein n=1 Tax=Clostridium botulinum TaxID=1491 RepID=UPI002492067D|nr:hypothetical protein [Clostridium botulinum]BDB00693.1 hypothetical protein CBOS2020_07670 [Clostridium botulinum]